MTADQNHRFTQAAVEALPAMADEPARLLQVDVDQFQHHLDGADLTEEEKRQYLEAVWAIIVSFVDLGFGVHPLQQACGQVDRIAAPGPETDHDGVNLNDQDLSEQFEAAADAAER